MKINLCGLSFSWVEVYKCSYLFEKPNSGRVRCRDCKNTIFAGLGIHRQAYRRSGYICFACFAKDLTVLTHSPIKDDSGFFVDSLGRLRACSLSAPTISTPEVVEAVYRALLEREYTTADILLGAESAHPWKILDAAEAAVGRA